MFLRKEFGKESIIIENDGNSVWAYLTDTNSNRPIKDVFVCSPIEPELELDKLHIENGNPPKMCRKYATSSAYIPDVENAKFSIILSGSSGNYCIYLNGEPIAAIYENFERGFSKSISIECGFGMPWNPALYNEKFS